MPLIVSGGAGRNGRRGLKNAVYIIQNRIAGKRQGRYRAVPAVYAPRSSVTVRPVYGAEPVLLMLTA